MILSIVIPAFNCADFLVRSVSSAMAFCSGRGEVIVVDDGSEDATPGILAELSRKYPGLRCFRTENGGLSRARNFGIERAAGDYIMLLDADDELILPRAQDFLSGHHEMVRIGVEEVGTDGAIVKHIGSAGVMGGAEYLGASLGARAFYTPSCAYVYRRSWLLGQRLRFEDGLLHEDMLFTPAALLRCDSLLVTDEIIYRYFRRSGSITQRVDPVQVSRRVASLGVISREITELANQHQSVDLGWWALDIIDYAAEIAAQAPSRALLWRLLKMELGFFLGYQAWGAHRVRRDVRFRVRRRAELWMKAWWPPLWA